MVNVIVSGETGIAYSYNEETGAYIGETECQVDPLTLEGLLVPRCATEIQPPVAPEGSHPFWNGTEWEVRELVVPTPTIEEETPPSE